MNLHHMRVGLFNVQPIREGCDTSNNRKKVAPTPPRSLSLVAKARSSQLTSSQVVVPHKRMGWRLSCPSSLRTRRTVRLVEFSIHYLLRFFSVGGHSSLR
jgi:hypothetical protein